MSTLRFICKRICCLMIIVISAVVITGCANLSTAEEETGQFIVNTRSGKIHSSSCQYVGQMNEENKKAVNSSLIDLLKQDYTICRKCRAGIGGPVGTEWVDSIVHPNLYIDDITIDASFNDYIKAVETMSEWYVDHIPTYAGGIQTEDFSKYRGELHNYKEYSLKNKGKIKTYKVLSSNSSEYNCNSLSKSDQILRANENAAKNYMDSYQSIKFKSKIAYYPCGELSMDSDYFTPGDDCVRYIFAICNKMDSQFTKKYRVLTRQTYSTTNSTDLTADRKDIAFGMNTLGFKIYDNNMIFR